MKRIGALVLVTLVLVLQVGDGALLRYFRTPSSRFVSAVTLDLWYAFWYSPDATFRSQMSESADGRLRAAFADIVASARRKGYRFREPELRQTKLALEEIMPAERWYILAMIYYRPNTVIVNRWWMARLDDRMLRALLAHELGHAIDHQNGRRGHPVLDTLPKGLSGDSVANTISRDLCDSDAYLALHGRIVELAGE